MKFINTIIFLFSALVIISCANEKKEEVQTEVPAAEVVIVDTIIDEPVEEVVEEVIPPQPTTLIVKNGEWLYDIARERYGDFHHWKKIYEANRDKISDPNVIYPGQELVLPE